MKKLTLTFIFLLLSISTVLFASRDLPHQKIDYEGMLYFNKAILELNSTKGDLNQAKSHLEKAEKIFKKNNNEDFLANTYIKQADIYLRIHHMEKADLCLELASMLSTTKRTALSLELAKTKLERLKGNLDIALASAHNAEKIALFLGNLHQIKRIQKLIQILQKPKYQKSNY